MRYQTVRDVIDHSKQLHGSIANLYSQLEQNSTQDRPKMMLRYLQRHEKAVEETLMKFENDVDQKHWEEWFQFAPEQTLDEVLSLDDTQKDMDVDSIVNLALKVDDYFISLYKDLSQNASSQQVRSVFENLVTLEESERNRTVRSAAELRDM